MSSHKFKITYLRNGMEDSKTYELTDALGQMELTSAASISNSGAFAQNKSCKRIRRQSGSPSKPDEGSSGDSGGGSGGDEDPDTPKPAQEGGAAKRPRESTTSTVGNPATPPSSASPSTSDVRVPGPEEDGCESDDDDYDDLIDDFATPADMDDYLDDEDVPDDGEDDISTASTRTTSSVGSNTPSVVGENLESFSLGEAAPGDAKVGAKREALDMGGPLVKNTEPALRRSLFSHVPPSINFVHHNEVPESPLPEEIRKNLRWRLSTITPAVVKKVVTNSGYRLMRKNSNCDWVATWGKHMKSPAFKETISEGQKINHFPGTFNIGRKDKLWKNYHKLRSKFGKEEFGFLPRTFCLPAETKLLRKVWEKRGVKAKWIVKPPAMSRGTGIKVINKWSQIPKNQPLIVQRYIARPHLINNTKYDLRIYVLMTSLHPLRIYLYDEGLVRFASAEYATNNDTLGDVFMHLTNYSINKNNASYCPNEDPEERKGHKWTLGSLWHYFTEQGIDYRPVWDKIKDMVIKTIISGEHSMFPLARANLSSHYCSYELFGFDVLLDADLKPWLIEVNISPSLHSSSPLDLDVKSPLATEVFNIVRYNIPNKLPMRAQRQFLQKLGMEDLQAPLCFDPRVYTRDVSKADRAKQVRVMESVESVDNGAVTDRERYLGPILDKLTPDDVRHLIRAEDEFARLTHFQRIFPTPETHKYLKFFSANRYHNFLMDAWEHKYGDCRSAGIDRLERLCQDKVHLRVPQAASSSSQASTSSPAAAKAAGNSVAAGKKGIVNVSMLKGPTGPSLSMTRGNSSIPEESSNTSPGSSVKKASFVAKPQHMSKSSSSSSIPRTLRSSSSTSSSKSGSPEPMSVDTSEGEDAAKFSSANDNQATLRAAVE